METLVQFGAGKIGRSFIGQLFSRGGYEVVFVDVDDRVVDALNERRSYRVEIRDDPPGEIIVNDVRAVHGKDREAVVAELVRARIASTAVGSGALRFVYPTLCAGLVARRAAGAPPLDVILCENLHGAAAIVAAGLRECLPHDFPLESAVGLVETSIGKMVPTLPEAAQEQDPLLVAAESYNTLIVDAQAFRSAPPAIPGLLPRDNMPAYVDRKLYVHNLGHAAIAYEAARIAPHLKTIDRAIAVPEVAALTRSAMDESARALSDAYPSEFTLPDLREHIQDLIRRFANPALGDTVYRVGRDVPRKLARHDRIIGAMRLDVQHNIEPLATARVAAAAMQFRVPDDSGKLDESDSRFAQVDYPRGLDHVLSHVCGLDRDDQTDRAVCRSIENAVRAMSA